MIFGISPIKLWAFPLESIQPIGPEYHPLSCFSFSFIYLSALLMGAPATAGVGCKIFTNSNTWIFFFSFPDIYDIKCWTWWSLRICGVSDIFTLIRLDSIFFFISSITNWCSLKFFLSFFSFSPNSLSCWLLWPLAIVPARASVLIFSLVFWCEGSENGCLRWI